MAHSTPDMKYTQMAIDLADRPAYSKDQLQTYFKRIQLPQQYRQSPLLSDPSLAKTKEHGLPFLSVLARYHVCSVPFENLGLHYSTTKTLNLNMDDLYEKFVGSGRGRGGYCMEQSGFFGTVLRSLGFDVRSCAGRVSRMCKPHAETRELQGQTYDGWDHMVNLVRLDERKYVVDVGMGAFGPNTALPLEDGFECESIKPRRIRLQWRPIPEHGAEKEEDAQKLWCLDVCFSPDAKAPDENVWIPVYCFTELEFLPQDYEMMSWFVSTNPKSFFTYAVLCMKMLMDEEGERVIGDITLSGDRVRRTIGGMIGGEKKLLRVLETEQDRVDALKEVFGVELTTEEKASIADAMKMQ